MAWSNTDPNYCYAVTVGNTAAAGLVPAASAGSGLTGFYKSTDEGLTWTKEVGMSVRHGFLLHHKITQITPIKRTG